MLDRERPLSGVLQEMVQQLQEILRAEIRLARAEVVHDAVALRAGTVWMATALLVAAIGVGCAIVALALVLGQVLPLWAAFVLVAMGTLAVSWVIALVGLHELRHLRGLPRTTQSMKELVQWRTP